MGRTVYIDKTLETLRRIYAQKENRTWKLRSMESDKGYKDKGNVGEGFVLWTADAVRSK